MYQDKNDLITCSKCNSQILSQVWQIHDIMCNKIARNKKQIKTAPSIIKSVISGPKYQDNLSQMIPCLTCGQNIPFTQYSLHQLQCVGNQTIQCRYCDIKFPIYLIQEHNTVCQAKKQLGELDNEDDDNSQIIDLRILISSLAIQKDQEQEGGLSQQQIKNIRDHVVLKEEQCSICCTPMRKMQRNMILNCKHIYHRQCLSPWLSQNPCCPYCRRHALKK